MATTTLAPGIVKRTSAYFIDPTKVTRRAGWNPRFEFGEISELAKSIRANGLLNPIRVKRAGEGFELVDGDRRLTAIELAIKEGHVFPEGIPAILVDKSQDDVTSLIQMFEANTGKPFLPLEEAAAYKRMKDAGLTIADIAKRVGFSAIHVSRALALLEADVSVQDAVASGEVSATTAKQIANAAKGDKAKQKELVEAAKGAGKDKKAKGRVKVAIHEERVKKAAAKGKTLKIRALTDDQLSELGSAMAKQLEDLLKEAGVASAEKLLVSVGADNAYAACFTLGALQALKAAAGMKINLKV